MFVSLNWLKKYVDIGSLSPEELGEKITKSGIEVDRIHYIATESTGVVVGHVTACEQHPQADKLKLCQVDVGHEQLQIICGAANIEQGQKVAVATPGAVLPGDFKINKVTLRGIESNGMICSLQELGVDDKYVPTDVAEGIFVFPDDVQVGEDVRTLLNLDDAVLEFDLTPNRADALSMIGVAYEVAAILDVPITLPDETLETIDKSSSDYISVQVEDSEQTPYYGGFLIKDLVIKQGPLWMRNYLMAAGIRPINNVVDITNFVMLEYGQPLHAFDYDRLDNKEILVRKAIAGEQILTLDDKMRTLTPDHLVVTDGKTPIALAGVMGGATTEVNDETTMILLETAYFNPESVRKTVQETGLRSEASTRLEKGVDPNRVKQAGIRASKLLQKYANAKVYADVAEFDALDKTAHTVEINTPEINKRLGTEITTREIGSVLTKLQFVFDEANDQFVVTIPTRRGDIMIFEDMLEEVARIYGYDHLPYTLPTGSSRPGALTEKQKMKRAIKSYLERAGLMEIITYSLTSKEDVKRLVSPEIAALKRKPVELTMPMSKDHKYLRLSMLPGHVQSLAYNQARTAGNIAYYEMGSVFIADESGDSKQPEERLRVAGALTGIWTEQKWQQEKKAVDFYVVKGIIEGLADYLNIPIEFKQAVLDDMHPGRSALLSIDGQTIGFIGQLHPEVAKEKEIKETYVFDLDVDTLLDVHDRTPGYKQIPKYPAITRDIAFVVQENVKSSHIQELIAMTGGPLVKDVQIFDVYTGDHLSAEKKSIAYRVYFQDEAKTLTDQEVDELYEKIVNQVNETFLAYVRSL